MQCSWRCWPFVWVLDLDIDLEQSLVLRAVDAFKHMNFKHPATPLSAVVGSLVTLGGLQAMEALLRKLAPGAMLFMSSFAALSTLLFAAPAAPLGVAWNTFLGHAISIG